MILEGKDAIDYINENIQYFKPKEFMCKCGCGGIIVDTDNLKRLDRFRGNVGVPVTINSAYRCEEHNRAEKGEPNSYHVKGMATDLTFRDFALHKQDAIRRLEELGFTGIGINYKTFIHVDNGTKRRW